VTIATSSARRTTNSERRKRADEAEQRLMITADGGGSNGSRVRLFKIELQKLGDETGQLCRNFAALCSDRHIG
jgi:hypothetical protein